MLTVIVGIYCRFSNFDMTSKQPAQQGTFIDTNEWVPIHTLPGFEACIEYFINRKGEIKSTKGAVERLLKLSPHNTGYLQVSLTQRIGRMKPIKVLVHKLVGFAFLGLPPTPYGQGIGCSMIDHIDENKLNNNADNLRWVTKSENNNKLPYRRFNGRVRTELTTTDERREATRIANRDYARRRREDGNKREYDRQRMRDLRADPTYLEHEREKAREYDKKRRERDAADPSKSEKQREYKREWMRKKRAAQKAVKIEECNDEN